MSDYFEMTASLQRPDPRDVMARIIAERRAFRFVDTCGGPFRSLPVFIGMDWGREDVPNRLYGATINSEGDAI